MGERRRPARPAAHPSRNRSRCARGALLAFASCAALGLGAPSPAAASSAWLPAQALTEAGQEAYSPVVASDSQGTVLAAWAQREGLEAKTRIYTALRPPGGTFGAAVAISPPGLEAQGPAVAFDSHGDAIAAWVRGGVVEAVMRPAGGSFGASQELSVEGESAYVARAIFDSQGDAIVIWRSDTGTSPHVTEKLEANVRPSGGSFGIPHQLDSIEQTSIEQHVELYPSRLAADAQGDVFAAWSTNFEETGIGELRRSAVKAAVSSDGAAFSTPTTLAEKSGAGPSAEKARFPDVAADPQGEALVVWEHYSPTGQKIEAKIRPAGGSFEATGETVSGAESADLPHVALAGNGEATVVYGAPVGGKPGVVAASRPANGGFGSPEPVSEAGVLSIEPVVSALADGEALVAWTRDEAPIRFEAATRRPGESFGAPQALSPTGEPGGLNELSLAVDGYGDAVASWRRFETGGNYLAEVAGYDGAGPALQNVSIPGQGTAGQPLSFSVSPLDVWSALAPTSWDFGDGAGASGTSVTHTYSTPGSYRVTVSSADVLGNLTSTSATVTVGSAPTPAGAPQVAIAPTITSVSQSHRLWRRGSRIARFARARRPRRARRPPIGTTFRFSLNEQASVRLAFTSLRSGRRVKGRCVARTRRNRHRHVCKRTVTNGALVFRGHPGRNKVTFQGRLSRSKRLKPGRYTLVIIATNAAGQRSAPKRLSFRIVR